MDTYWETLQAERGLTDERFRIACQEIRTTSDWFPTIAQLIAVTDRLAEQRVGGGVPLALPGPPLAPTELERTWEWPVREDGSLDTDAWYHLSRKYRGLPPGDDRPFAVKGFLGGRR